MKNDIIFELVSKKFDDVKDFSENIHKETAMVEEHLSKLHQIFKNEFDLNKFHPRKIDKYSSELYDFDFSDYGNQKENKYNDDYPDDCYNYSDEDYESDINYVSSSLSKNEDLANKNFDFIEHMLRRLPVLSILMLLSNITLFTFTLNFMPLILLDSFILFLFSSEMYLSSILHERKQNKSSEKDKIKPEKSSKEHKGRIKLEISNTDKLLTAFANAINPQEMLKVTDKMNDQVIVNNIIIENTDKIASSSLFAINERLKATLKTSEDGFIKDFSSSK